MVGGDKDQKKKKRNKIMANRFNEVDEDIRKERYQSLWNKYGKYVISLIVLIIVIFSISQYSKQKNIIDNKKLFFKWIFFWFFASQNLRFPILFTFLTFNFFKNFSLSRFCGNAVSIL